MTRPARWLCWLSLLGVAVAEEHQDASCMLQAQRSAAGAQLGLTPQQLLQEQEDLERFDRLARELEENGVLTAGQAVEETAFQDTEASQLFCEYGTTTLDFKTFSHGEEVKPNSIPGVTITGHRRVTNGGIPCTGPLMILNNREGGATTDHDLATCSNCALLVYSEDGDSQVVDDCAERPGPKFIFEWDAVKDLKNIVLWDQDDGTDTKVQLFNEMDELIEEKVVTQNSALEGKGTTVDLRTRGVKKLIVLMAGSGAIVRIKQCGEQGSEYGDPHILTLDGDKFDLYENGTFSLFHFSGRKTQFRSKPKQEAKTGVIDWQLFAHYGGPTWTAQGLLLVDSSDGEFRQAMELTAKDCQWRSKTSLRGDWRNVGKNSSLAFLQGADYLSGFEFYNEKHLSLRMNTLEGLVESIKLHTVCKPKGINVRVAMPDIAESRFLQGQIEVGNGRRQNKFAVNKKWTALGGSEYANHFFQGLSGQQYSLLTSCTGSERAKAEKICVKHLGAKLQHAKGADGVIFSDCVFDVCRGGEDFAIAAAEMLKK